MRIIKKQTTKVIEITKSDILSYLMDIKKISNEKEIKSIYVEVPSGGDYSGCSLDFDECPLYVKIETNDIS